jgi:hypothetical protein
LGWTLGVTCSPCPKFHPSSKFQDETVVNSLKFKPRDILDFVFEIHFESEETSMEKVVHLSQIFKTIFYSKFLELRKVNFRSVKI